MVRIFGSENDREDDFTRTELISNTNDLLSEYDFVIVGGGTSGLTVANRLSEEPCDDNDEDSVTIPGLAGTAAGTKYDWNISYTANEALGGRALPVPQGKVVGGSTKLNRMVFDRGAKSDYDTWEALGNKGWNFESLLPYFKKSEKFTPPSKEILADYDIKWDLEYHGENGYIQSSYSPFFWPSMKNIVEATKELQISISTDQASGKALGGFYCPHNQDPVKVIRSSAEDYYVAAQARASFHLLTGQQVTQIITSAVDGTIKASGVRFATSAASDVQIVRAKKEVILAAGALHTPQLLQVSGIGDRALLSSINVETVVDLPAVGQNLHDHTLVTVMNSVNASYTLTNLQQNATFAAEAKAQYDSEKRGPLTSSVVDFMLFLPLSAYSNATSTIHSEAIAADISISLPLGVPTNSVAGYKTSYQALVQKLIAEDAAVLEIVWADGIFMLGLQQPFSRGNVKAASSSVFDAPIADAGLLRNPIDVAILREGVKYSRRIVATDAIASLGPVEILPGANVTSDADLDAFVRASADTIIHPVGSCKMGPRDEGGVVDADLRVYGVEGLRVVDASVIPIIPATHMMTTVYAVAERAADIIKGKVLSRPRD
ncbi:GMC oxidoreductase [Corynespora cassiicola Philippines]|uniref:GMC oxidoreductase n=1 Tax=Corynespora cassiicola Philippines TaxID=1448308 RepID=A0A2T2N1N0_CORCC|nr:GMC oxidoreductase [Corynespora cassiicola Philippines]